MKRSFELSVTLCDALVILLMLLKPSKVSVQAQGTSYNRVKEIHLTALNGSLSSPNYPRIYPKNTEWTWIIKPSKYTVILEVKEIDLYRCYFVGSQHEECDGYDHVILDNQGMFCNGMRPDDNVMSFEPWKEIRITFKSLYVRKECRGNGFKADYRMVIMSTVAPSTLVPTSYSTNKHNTVESSQEILEVTIPIVLGIVVVAIFLIVLTVWCCRKKSNNRQSPPGNRNARAIESRNRLLGLEIEHQPARHAGRSARDESIRYSHILRNDVFHSGVPLNYGPPPSYDEIGRNDRSHNSEFPPSYESVMNESTAHSPESSSQAASGVHGNSDDSQGDPNPRLLSQLRPAATNEASSRERNEVFV